MTGVNLQIVSGLFYGGGQQVALDMVRVLGGSGAISTELCLMGNASVTMTAHGHHSVAFDGRYNRVGCLLSTATKLRRLMRSLSARIIHTHGWDASIIGALAIRGLRVAQVIHWHTTDPWLTSTRLTHRVRRWMTRRLLSGRGKQVVAVSDASRRHLCKNLGWPIERVEVIHNGIDIDRFSPSVPGGHIERDGDKFVVGIAARLASGKGIDHLLQAVARVRARTGRDLRVRVAGEGDFRPTLEAEVTRLGLEGHVEFLGQVQDTPAFYRMLDIFALPSLSEGLPLSMLEAMACECPVIATDVGGVTEALRHGVDGLVVQPRDVEGLAAALGRLTEDAELRQRMGRSGRTRVLSGFTLTGMAEQVARSYQKVLGSLESSTW